MTEQQVKRIQVKIDKCKKALAADKRKWGGYYDDSRGIRYLAPELYIKIKDYEGGRKYLKWFDKNFPDDSGFPEFLFEATFILFKCGDLKGAANKAHRTYFTNTCLFDKFMGKLCEKRLEKPFSSLQSEEYLENFNYTVSDDEFHDFGVWIETFLSDGNFKKLALEYFEIEEKLSHTEVGPERSKLVKRLFDIKKP
ncbi:MAG: hypothetical protein IPP34_11815 [Bacteroidetes bacterium]|nr:hypothetical protein [Bacteroidota bacterium]